MVDLNRIIDSFTKLINAIMNRVNYHGIWEYKIVNTTSVMENFFAVKIDVTIDAEPVDPKCPFPKLTGLKIKPNIPGMRVCPKINSICYIQFVNEDSKKPIIIHFDQDEDACFLDIKTTKDINNVGKIVNDTFYGKISLKSDKYINIYGTNSNNLYRTNVQIGCLNSYPDILNPDIDGDGYGYIGIGCQLGETDIWGDNIIIGKNSGSGASIYRSTNVDIWGKNITTRANDFIGLYSDGDIVISTPTSSATDNDITIDSNKNVVINADNDININTINDVNIDANNNITIGASSDLVEIGSGSEIPVDATGRVIRIGDTVNIAGLGPALITAVPATPVSKVKC